MIQMTVVLGDITDQRVDAIVNAANTDLVLGSGVAGAIRRKGGPGIQEECARTGPIPIGEAAVTGAGDLPCRLVIHAASMSFDQPTTEASLGNAVRNSLTRCAERGVATVAFPAVGTGVGGFTMSACADIMVEAVVAHEQASALPREVRFVVTDETAAAEFRRAIARRRPGAA